MPRILLVEDHAPLRTLLDLYLTRRGYRVETAGDGLEALEALGRELPDVVITDLNMPRVDGIELARRMRADPATRSIPIIMVSAALREDLGGDAAPDRFVRKPMTMADLARELDGVLTPG